MVLLRFPAVLIKFILYISVAAETKSTNHNSVLLSWKEDYDIKELSTDHIPEDCHKIGICSNITIYDTQFVTNLLNKLRSQKNFKTLMVDQLTVPNSFGLGEIDELCASKEEIIWPQAAKDIRGHWQYIANTGAIRFQGFRINRCIERGSSCSKAAIFNEFDSICVQEILMRKMVYIDINNKQLATDFFEIPTCCSCKIKQNFL